MTVKRNTSGLRRGPATAEQKKNLTQSGTKARKLYKEADDKIGELASADPYAAYPEIHANMAAHLAKLIRDERRDGGTPSREVTDRLREYRQLTEALNEYNRARGDVSPTESILAEMETRLSEANLGEGPAPYLERPSRPG